MTSFPEWLVPMAATLTQERFTGPEWIVERKFDGIRLLAFKQGSDVRLYSRNRLPQDIPTVAEAIAKLPVREVILDGEITWGPSTREDDDARSGQGPSTRQDDDARSGQGPSTRQDDDARSGQGGRGYHVFDILWLDGRSVTSLPLDQRRALLAKLPFGAPLRRVEAIDDPEPWDRARREGWEGVILKRRDSPYEHRRSKQWLKMKCEAAQDFVVGGFTDPQGGRVGLGALLVGYFEGGDFVFAGKVGTGFDTKLLLGLRARLDAIEVPTSPFTKATGLPRLRAHWVRPGIVVHVAFIEWTVHRKLRHSRLLGVKP